MGKMPSIAALLSRPYRGEITHRSSNASLRPGVFARVESLRILFIQLFEMTCMNTSLHYI